MKLIRRNAARRLRVRHDGRRLSLTQMRDREQWRQATKIGNRRKRAKAKE